MLLPHCADAVAAATAAIDYRIRSQRIVRVRVDHRVLGLGVVLLLLNGQLFMYKNYYNAFVHLFVRIDFDRHIRWQIHQH